MLQILGYVVAAVAVLAGLAVAGAGIILGSMFFGSHVTSDQRIGVVILLLALCISALPLVGGVCLLRGRETLGWVLCGIALVLATPALVLLPGVIEAAARP